jgi:hypothetical protein
MFETCQVSHVVELEEHSWIAELRAALLKFGGDDTVRLAPIQYFDVGK